jgi:hypothetical protein
VLQEVQRVQLAPVDQAPQVVAEIDPLGNVQGSGALARSAPEALVVSPPTDAPRLAADLTTATPIGDRMDRLYRPQALDVPVLVSRDGPIAAIDPRLGDRRDGANQTAQAIDGAIAEANADVQVVAADAPMLELLAVRPSWVRVQSADGTVLFEKVLDAGERYAVPAMETAPVLRAGNSGSVYFSVQGQTYGPAAPGAQVVKNVILSPEALTETYALADLNGDEDLQRFVNVAEVTNP